MIDKLRVAGVMKNKLRAQRGVYFHNSDTRSLSSLSCCSFVSHKDSPSLVTLKSGGVWLKYVQSTLSHLILTSVPRATFTRFLLEHELFQYYS